MDSKKYYYAINKAYFVFYKKDYRGPFVAQASFVCMVLYA